MTLSGLRLFALVGETQAPRTKHFQGLPPELTGRADTRVELPRTRVVLLEQSEDGVYLNRVGNDGAYAGDTWHPSVDEAKDQAAFEFGVDLGEWRSIDEDVRDTWEFAVQVAARENHNS